MKRLALAAVALLAVGCSPGPGVTTEQGEEFESLWQVFFVIAVIVVLLIWGLVMWCVFRYRRRPEHDDTLPNQGGDRPRLEIGLMLGPLVIVAFLFVLSVVGERRINEEDDDPDLVVEVVGYRWDWEFTYPDSGVSVVGAPDERPVLVLPVGRTVRFELRHRGRHPLVLGARVRHEAGHDPEGRQRDRHRHHRAGPVDGALRRVLRSRPRDDGLRGPGPAR